MIAYGQQETKIDLLNNEAIARYDHGSCFAQSQTIL